MQNIIQIGVQPNVQKFLQDAQNNNHKAIRQHLATDPSIVNETNEIGETALHKAITRIWDYHYCPENSFKTSKLLIEGGINVNAQTQNGSTPLHYALLRWTSYPDTMKKIVELLLYNKCNIELQSEGLTPFHLAIDQNVEIVRCFLQRYPECINWKIHHSNVLHFAATFGKSEILTFFLENRTEELDINVRGNSGHTPLMCALFKGHHQCLQILLNFKANFSSTSYDSGLRAIQECNKHPFKRVHKNLRTCLWIVKCDDISKTSNLWNNKKITKPDWKQYFSTYLKKHSQPIPNKSRYFTIKSKVQDT